ncbi:MAG: hypothetical protein H0X17_12910 [Deltaproteobacteria bacterium]|nr:hypothetical protein [Deltaproteobacteria bacterium]
MTTVTVMQKLEQGVAAGTLATLPMTAVMVVAQHFGLLGKAPPAKITDAMLDKADVSAPPWERRLLTALAHFGFGAGSGALYSLLRPGRPSFGRATVEGMAFGTAVWGASYAGWVPALGILPPPTEDRKDRQLTMVVAHWVFGAAVGLLVAARRR